MFRKLKIITQKSFSDVSPKKSQVYLTERLNIEAKIHLNS